MSKSVKQFLPVFILFAVLTALVAISGVWLTQWGFHQATLLWGNMFLFLLSLISFVLLQKAIQSASPQVFVRYFYISFMVKFLLVAITVLIYAKVSTSINRASIIACMSLYIVYTFVEMRILLKAGKK